MSDDLELVLVICLGEVLPAIVFIYATYWALEIRRALISRMYRRQALWLGVLAALVAVNVFVTYSTSPAITDAINVFDALVFAAAFGYIDSVIPVLRRSDPLVRGIVRWGTLRYFLWFVWVLLAASYVLPGLFPSLVSQTAGYVLENAFATVLFGASAIALVVGVRRSGDMILRSCLKWLGAILLLTLLEFVYDFAELALFPNMTYFQYFYSYAYLPIGALYVGMGYSFYRSAKALAPVGKIQDLSRETVNE